MKDAQAKQEADAKQAAVLADAKTAFKDVKFADNATVREIQESAVVAQGIFTKDEVAKLAGERKSLGSILLGDAAMNKAAPSIDFNKTYNS